VYRQYFFLLRKVILLLISRGANKKWNHFQSDYVWRLYCHLNNHFENKEKQLKKTRFPVQLMEKIAPCCGKSTHLPLVYIQIIFSSRTMKFKYQGVCIFAIFFYILQVTYILLNPKLHKMNILYYFILIKRTLYSKDDFLSSESITEGATWF
jgi:hypothetical protein